MSEYDELFGDEAVPGARGDTPLSELKLAAEHLAMQPGELLIDLGCGIGGPGLWVARHLKAVLLGLDLDVRLLEEARRRAQGYPATYLHRDFHMTGLEDACADGILSLDALWHTNRLGDALKEAFRLLKPGRRLALTLVERDRLELPGRLIFEKPTEGWKERRPDQDLSLLSRRLVILET